MLKDLMPNRQAEGGVKLFRDRSALLTTGLLITLAALAWVGVIQESMRMQDSSMIEQEMGMAMSVASSQNMLVEALAFLLAWGVMMAAMMLPSATPMIALYGTVRRTFSQNGQKAIPTALFALVYLIVWLVFGIPVYAADVAVDTTADIYPAIADLLPYAVAVVLLGAGAYQFSSMKQVCLRVCQSPLAFLTGHWRNGYVGTIRMALEHAVYCVGCCWALMIVLVAAGAMALHWVLLIAALVFAEKILAHAKWTARIIGVALILLGILVAMQPDLVIVLRGQIM
jgi:predicted metal-binding membrane protein